MAPPAIDPAVIARYGEVKLAYVLLGNATVGATPPRLKKVARAVEQELRNALSPSALGASLVGWQRLAADMGLSSRADLPAPHGLVADVLAGRTMPKINCIVDAANITALKFQTPVGVFDHDRLTAPITLRLAGADEEIVPILASEALRCVPGEIVYADAIRVFSRYSRDADFSKVTEDTRNLLCVVDGTPATRTDVLLEAASFLIGLICDVSVSRLEVSGPHLAPVMDATAHRS